MDDFGLNSITDAAIYSVNVENGNEYIDQDGRNRFMRIRGLSIPTYSRMSFESRVPSDSYNIQRYDVAYGPDPILFGMG